MSQKNDVFNLYPETLVIGGGVTALIPNIPYQNGLYLKLGSGASIFIQGLTLSINGSFYGSTFATAQQYAVGATEVFYSQNMCGAFTLLGGSGVTSTVYLVRTQSEGSESNLNHGN